jgi:hypothetical protein
MCGTNSNEATLCHLFPIAVVAKDNSLTSSAGAAALLGCARLGIHPGPEVIAACWEAVLRTGTLNLQAVANTALALAMLEVRRRPWQLTYCRLQPVSLHPLKWKQGWGTECRPSVTSMTSGA